MLAIESRFRRQIRRSLPCLITGVALLLVTSGPVWAHGFAGKRFFPSTLTIDDPSVADEADLLLHHAQPRDGTGATVDSTSLSIAWAKRITKRLGFEWSAAYDHIVLPGEGERNGFGNIGVGFKYLALVDGPREALLSLGVDAKLGGTGSRNVDAEPFSTITPALFFGKGLGGLPDSFRFLRPMAVTGIAGLAIATRASTPDHVNWGFSVQYSVQYLQSFVQDIGLEYPIDRLIPLVEFPLSTCINHGCGGLTTGTVNPGLVWFGRSGQLAVEVPIPINRRSGTGVGVLFQIHLYLDDLLPHSLGTPLLRGT